METRDNHLQALSAIFFIPTRETEPPVIAIVFEDWTMATAHYEELIENFKNKELHIHFKEILDNEIEMAFLRNKDGMWITGAKVQYDKKQFENFISVVDEKRTYVVSFGHLDKKGMFISANIPGNIQPVIITFQGYSK